MPAMSQPRVAHGRGVTMKRLRILAGAGAAVSIVLSAATDSLFWAGAAVVGTVALLLIGLRERRHH